MKNINTTSQIRAAFLDFFARHGHLTLPSSSLVPHNDPSLMFANAGMNQFKDIFTGNEKTKSPRAATAQKCVRAGGKHNDLDNVGYTARHHTFFEMLGNFSFGDYFKEEAINFAWELLTKDYGLNPDKLCVTVYHDDDFAWNHWKKITGFADHKIIRIASNDNFWSMGDVGPCGPCSEIFYDHGEHIFGGPPGSKDADGDRFVEIWNLVFMQYEQLPDGKRINLPKPSIDTGMGLERISAVMQGVHNNYDIDLFKNLISDVKELSGAGKTHNHQSAYESAYKVIADHLRSSCFLIADGVMPSNEGRGYVLRRIMRRAMRYAHQLGCKEPLMHRLVSSLVREMSGQYPELKRAQAVITENLRAEEERFKETLERGLKLLDESITAETKIFAGEIAFKLYDTYGFPLDLTQDILRAKEITVDVAGFDECMENQREMARAAHKGSGDAAVGKIWFAIKEKLGSTKFLGYDLDSCEAEVTAIIKDGEEVQTANPFDEVEIILNQTVFYGESGGQVGDVGTITKYHNNGKNNGKKGESSVDALITNTQKPLEDFYVHYAKLSAPLAVGDKLFIEIDKSRRSKIRKNHSATHLLHKALRNHLGEHVTQKGSLVNDDKLRFDFSHGKPLSKEEIALIEQEVNSIITNSIMIKGGDVSCQIMSPDAAIKAGAMALFGEKYGEEVRVLSIGKTSSGDAYSVELCGGTHVANVFDIGLFKIISESSISSGIRRIEAISSENVRKYMFAEIAKLAERYAEISENYEITEIDSLRDKILNSPLSEINIIFAQAIYELQKKIVDQEEKNKQLAKNQAEAKRHEAINTAKSDITSVLINGRRFIGRIFDNIDAKELRLVAEIYLQHSDITALISKADNKAAILIAVSSNHSAKINAVDLVKEAVIILGGKGGGGKPEMAQGGGSDANKAEEVLNHIKQKLAQIQA